MEQVVEQVASGQAATEDNTLKDQLSKPLKPRGKNLLMDGTPMDIHYSDEGNLYEICLDG